MFDAYTVKKVLPRLVIAAILIQLSWPLFTLFISLVSNIAWGIEGLLYAPFGGRDQLEIGQILEGAAGNGTFTLAAALTGAGAVGGVIALGGAGLLSLGITILLALMIGFFVLAIRQVVIVVLLVTAPIALVAWILPGTEKVWKLWWESFSKALFMYPLILLLIAGGRIAAKIAAGNPDASGDGSINLGNDPFQFAIVLLAFFGPFFLIPKTFQVAGSAFANIAGVANNRSRGVFDRLSKGRQTRAAERFERAGRNALWNTNSRIGSKANTAAGWFADPLSNARIKSGSRSGKAMAAELTQKSGQQSQELAKWMSSAGLNQEALSAIMSNVQDNGGRLNSADLEKTAKEYLRTNEDGTPMYNTQYRAAANQLLSAAPFLNQAFKSEEYGRANIGMAAGIAKAGQGFLNSSDPAETAKYANFLNSVAPGLGDTFKTQAALASGQAGGLGKVGYSEQVDAEGNYVAGGTAARAIQFTRSSVQDLAGAKGGQLREQFINNGAIKSVITADTSDGKVVEFVDPATGEKAKIDESTRVAALDNIIQAAYGYNTPAETAAVLRKQLADLGTTSPALGEEIKQATIRITRNQVDPARRDT